MNQRMRQLGAGSICLLAFALVASAAIAADLRRANEAVASEAALSDGAATKPEEVALPAAPAPIETLDEFSQVEWEDYAASLRARVREAEARLAAAKRTFVKGRHTRKIRGDERATAKLEFQRAGQELRDARSALAKLPEEARRAGVPPGWLRERD